MYHSWWFIGVLILLAINLTACSLKRLPNLWRQIRLAKRGYARLGTYLIHLSVLLILLGGLFGAIWGLKGYMEITEGETVKEISFKSPHNESTPLEFTLRCDSFRVDFYPDGSPKEYVSILTFMEGEDVVLDHVPLRVNHPISYRGLTFYQASYGISDRSLNASLEIVRRERGGGSSTLTIGRGEIKPIPGTRDQIGFMKYRPKVLFSTNAPPESFWLIRQFPGLDGLQVGKYTFVLKDIERKYYTGIQVTRDPGVPIVWIGCTLLVTGMVITFTLRRPQKKVAS
jgi:cytochrome c biogenesis protein